MTLDWNLINTLVNNWSRVNLFLQACHWELIDTYESVNTRPTVDSLSVNRDIGWVLVTYWWRSTCRSSVDWGVNLEFSVSINTQPQIHLVFTSSSKVGCQIFSKHLDVVQSFYSSFVNHKSNYNKSLNKNLACGPTGGIPVLVTAFDQYYPYYKHQLNSICWTMILITFGTIHLPCLCTNDLSEIYSFAQISLHTENGVPDSKAAG